MDHDDIPRPKSQPINPTQPHHQSYRPQFSDPWHDENETHSRELNPGTRSGYLESIASSTDPEYNKTRRTLHEAVAEGDFDMVSILLDEGADLEAMSDDGFTPLHMAVTAGQEWIVVQLLDAGANINAETSNEEKPLHLAIKRDDKLMTGILLDSGADIHGKYSDGSTTLHGAAWAGKA